MLMNECEFTNSGEGLIKFLRHSGSVEKLIEANAEILFSQLCGIAKWWDAVVLRLRVKACNDVKFDITQKTNN